jgi:hypothetical protein
MATKTDDVVAGATCMVNATVEPLPENESVRKATVVGSAPI